MPEPGPAPFRPPWSRPPRSRLAEDGGPDQSAAVSSGRGVGRSDLARQQHFEPEGDQLSQGLARRAGLPLSRHAERVTHARRQSRVVEAGKRAAQVDGAGSRITVLQEARVLGPTGGKAGSPRARCQRCRPPAPALRQVGEAVAGTDHGGAAGPGWDLDDPASGARSATGRPAFSPRSGPRWPWAPSPPG